MMAMTATAETVTAMATAKAVAMAKVVVMAMIPPPPLMATMLMKMMAVFRGWRLDNNNGTLSMRWRWAASNMQNVCKCCTIYPKTTNVDSLGRRR